MFINSLFSVYFLYIICHLPVYSKTSKKSKFTFVGGKKPPLYTVLGVGILYRSICGVTAAMSKWSYCFPIPLPLPLHGIQHTPPSFGLTGKTLFERN